MRRIREKREGSKVLQIHKRTREGLRVNVRYQFDFFMLLNFNQYLQFRCCCCCWRSQAGCLWTHIWPEIISHRSIEPIEREVCVLAKDVWRGLLASGFMM
ncbi:hypothetical protein ASPFODRAFT_406955 [Aspergillus luchuensis CBS 106.47]|uniref:Uncharacterized protein n=1 Tax=Aspergillus luchuensis (strain CBS 106.47) TaxID=1137211 RepID=A0A1M3T201_ASPLC|nr:hypothetical protein ASPFODRAFT_406955 [Aspergillus luchuensis CBS 106.47]